MSPFLILFLGVLTGIAIAVIIIGSNNSLDVDTNYQEEEFDIVMRQSLMFKISTMLEDMRTETLTQSQLYNGEPTKVRFVQTPDDRIFWIEGNELFWTEVGFEGFDMSDKRPAQTTNLTEDEMESLLIILNILQNG